MLSVIFICKFKVKSCVHYFLSNFHFSPNDSSSKTMRHVFILFHLKDSFCSRDIQTFVFLSSPLFALVSYCFRGWSKTNHKVYDIINCLSKKLITNFVWYLGKEKRYDIETLSIFLEKSCRKCVPKASSRALFNFGK